MVVFHVPRMGLINAKRVALGRHAKSLCYGERLDD